MDCLVLGHQLSPCLGTAGFPRASQRFTEVSTWSLDQNKGIKKKGDQHLWTKNLPAWVTMKLWCFPIYLGWRHLLTPLIILALKVYHFGGLWGEIDVLITHPISGNFSGEELTVANQILTSSQLLTSVSICFRAKTFHTRCKPTCS